MRTLSRRATCGMALFTLLAQPLACRSSDEADPSRGGGSSLDVDAEPDPSQNEAGASAGGDSGGAGDVSTGTGGTAGTATDGQGGAEVSQEACTNESCCQAVGVKLEASSVYLVAGKLSLYVLLSNEGRGATGWSVELDASIGSAHLPVLSSGTHTGQYPYISVETESVDAGAIECGAAVPVELRVRTSTFGEDLTTAICAPNQFGPTQRTEMLVECPECPAYPERGASCDVSDRNACSIPTGGDPHCGFVSELSCPCQLNFNTGERFWSCAVC